MIDIKWVPDPKKVAGWKGAIYVDGAAIHGCAYRTSYGNDVTIDLDDVEGAKVFLCQRVSDLRRVLPLPGKTFDRYVRLTRLPGTFEWWHDAFQITIRLDEKRGSIDVALLADLEHWHKPWSFSRYQSEFCTILAAKTDEIHLFLVPDEPDEFPGSGFNLTCEVDANCPLSEIRTISELLGPIHAQTERELAAQIRPDSVVTYFTFPPQVKTACEQYLLYFGQFLADLGMEADCEIKEQLGEILFTVTPATAEEALDKIRAALEVYLSLPTSPVDTSVALSSEIEVQRLIAQIQHLNGQLTLASAVIQANEAAIEAQRTTIRVLTGEIVAHSVTLSNAPVNDEEEILDGMVSITKYEGKGFKVDLPEVFRRLKKLFQQE